MKWSKVAGLVLIYLGLVYIFDVFYISPRIRATVAPTPVLSIPSQRHLLGALEGAGVLEMSPDGNWLLARGSIALDDNSHWEDTARLWKVDQKPRTLQKGVALDEGEWHFAQNGQLVACEEKPKARNKYTPRILVASPSTPFKLRVYNDHSLGESDEENYPLLAQISRDGSQVWALTPRYFRVFQARTGKLICCVRWGEKTLNRQFDSLKYPEISTDGQTVSLHVSPTQIRLYSTRTGQFLQTRAIKTPNFDYGWAENKWARYNLDGDNVWYYLK